MTGQIQNVDQGQDPILLQGISEAIRSILTPDEDVIYIALQDAKAPVMKKAAAVATDRRIILYRPGMVSGFTMWDAHWQDVQDIRIKSGMMFADLVITKTNGETVTLEKVNKQQGSRWYSFAQQQEHEWREHRRQRQMEEDRARSGGVVVHSTPQSVTPASAPASDPVQKLQQAKQMLDAGLISAEEYDTTKQRILSQM